MSDYRIVFLDADTVGDVPNLDCFSELGTYTVYPHTQPEEVGERIANQEVVITNKVKIGSEIIRDASSLRLICVAATGMNNVDLSAARQQNIVVENVENYSTHSVAQVTIGVLLQLLHRHDYYNNFVYSGSYSQQPLFTHLGHSFWQLKGRQVGIIGLGNIGKQVAKIAEAMGARIVYFSTSGKNNDAAYSQLSLEELLQTSDVVSVHAPLNENTRNLLDYAQLSKMPAHSILLNTGRGGIVNEADLAQAIDEEVIAGAAIDVYQEEPFPLSHPYLQVKNKERLLLTPHVSWASMEARTLLIDRVYQNIRAFFKDHS
ncbi:D-2-hydroxyacid dehydrogenase [Tunicatimonas pelagia]|uniref:D-2-hydroxyacid dehydrogenase n=1 Tax=Tunicatimonas pelagia TaxID=931531 RepID=UPI002665182A|nr:D-2-hydroxyacid dehydrogenase [Tunicatimonas pelagia]WKN43862.1 D-2-hydroxyacid dehydrogenase [Tunicatimonas pelagia]